MFQQN